MDMASSTVSQEVRYLSLLRGGGEGCAQTTAKGNKLTTINHHLVQLQQLSQEAPITCIWMDVRMQGKFFTLHLHESQE